MDITIRISGEHHKRLRLDAFEKHKSIQGELDEILSQHFDTRTARGK